MKLSEAMAKATPGPITLGVCFMLEGKDGGYIARMDASEGRQWRYDAALISHWSEHGPALVKALERALYALEPVSDEEPIKGVFRDSVDALVRARDVKNPAERNADQAKPETIGKVMAMGVAGLSELTVRLLADGGSVQEMLLAYACLHSGSGAGYLLVVHDLDDVDYASDEWRDPLLQLGVEATLLDALREAQRRGCWYLRLDEAHD